MVPIFSILGATSRGLVTGPCPSCASNERSLLLRRDRYFLPIEVSQCRSCNLVYTAKTLSSHTIREFYAKNYPRLMTMSYEQSKVEGCRQAAIRAQQIFAKISIDSVIEIGCGDGYFLRECIARNVTQVLGIEPGVARRRNAIEAGCDQGLVIDRMVEDLTDLPFRPQVVTLFHVLEHLNDPVAVLKQVAKLTTEWVIIEVPDIMGDWSSLGLQFFHVSHRSYFSRQTLVSMLRRCGLEPIFIEQEGREGGIYPGNLRIYAKCQKASPGVLSDPSTQLPIGQAQLEQVRRYLKRSSLKHGYPRSAVRLIRIGLFG